MKIVRGFNAGVCSLRPAVFSLQSAVCRLRSMACLVVILALSLSVPALPPAGAATQYADSATTTTWDHGITLNWGNASSGPYNSAWTNGNDAIFEGTAGTSTSPAAEPPLITSILTPQVI